MMIDMNADGSMVAEVTATADLPYTAPPRTPIREQVIIRGSTSAGQTTSAGGTPDESEGG